MREALRDCPVWFNGRYIIPCAVVAGGKKGGVTRGNFNEVLIEFERYLDSDEYNVDSDGVRKVSNEDWVPKAPVYTITDWHDSRRYDCIMHVLSLVYEYYLLVVHTFIQSLNTHRYSPVLEAAKKRLHELFGLTPQTTFETQPCDVQGFDKGKGEVEDIKVARNLIGEQSRYTNVNVWVTAIKTKW